MISRHYSSGSDRIRLTDGELWQLFKSGDEAAFEAIYDAHADALYNYGMNFDRDSLTVKECLQDLFVEIWNRRDYLGSTDNIRYYLLKSLRRKIFATQKEQKRWMFEGLNEKMGIINLLNRKSMEHFSEDEFSDDDVKKKMTGAIEKLPVRQKEALFQIYYEKLTYEEAASVMDVNIKTVYNLVWRGVEKLRKDLR